MKHIRTIYGVAIASVVTPLITLAQGGFSGQSAFSFPNYYQTGSGFSGGFGGGNGGYGYQTRGARFGDIESLITLANTFLGYMQVGIFLAALFYFLLGAYAMVTGDVSGGSKKLLYAAGGAAAAILAFSIIPLVCFLTQAGGRACGL